MSARIVTIDQPVLIDTFRIDGEMIVCDPCYDPEWSHFDLLGRKLNVKPGRWGLYVRRIAVDFMCENHRIVDQRNMNALAVHQDLFPFVAAGGRFRWEYAGFNCCVDSGRIGFHNATQLPSESYGPQAFKEYYNATMHADDDVLHEYNSALASSGRGDGEYYAFIARASTNAIVAVKIDFLEDEVSWHRAQASLHREPLVVERGKNTHSRSHTILGRL